MFPLSLYLTFQFASPLQKHDGTNGIAALVGHWCGKLFLRNKMSSSSCSHSADEDYKGAGHILEHLTSSAFRQSSTNENPTSRSHVGPAQSQSQPSPLSDPTQSPMLHAFSYAGRGDVWSWFEQPSNVMRFKRFGAAMKGVSSVQTEDAILKGALNKDKNSSFLGSHHNFFCHNQICSGT